MILNNYSRLEPFFDDILVYQSGHDKSYTQRTNYANKFVGYTKFKEAVQSLVHQCNNTFTFFCLF